MEPLLIQNDLDRNNTAFLVIDTPHDLTETALTEQINNLVAV